MADFAARPSAPPTGAPTRRMVVPRVERQTLWRGLWWPFWAWSDLPAPDFPAREPKPVGPLGPAGEAFLAGLDAIRRRLWLRHAALILVRAVWLGLAGACLWAALQLPLAGAALDLRLLGWILLGLLALGVVFALSAKPSRVRTARMLDRTFGLQERMTTAAEDLGRGVPEPGERAAVVYLQMADGANAIDELRRHSALGWRVPTREIVLAVFWALTLAALAFLRGVGGGPPPLVAASVPPFTPAIERPEAPAPVAPADLTDAAAPSVEEVLERSARSSEARQDLEALAGALEDHAVTSEASAAIRAGDFERAADGLRELAPDAGELSEVSRGDLASDLEGAAGRMSPEGEGLQQASEQAASGLRQGEQPASEGLRSLAEAVERTGDQVAPQGELAEQMQQAQQAAARGEQGRPEAGDPGQGQPGEGQPQGPPQQGDDPGSGADAQGQSGEAGPAGEASQGQAGEPGQSEQGGAPGDAGQPGEAGQSGSGEQPGEAGEAGAQGQGQAQGQGEADAAAQGSGAGSGEGEEGQGEPEAGSGSGDEQEAGEGEPGVERVGAGDGGRGEA
ncbi:MAG TPA: hypothetical protein VER37_08120, partial [Thermomicrobiales bacterium]|nr:hypothetical protein [Thermomicrobiales bacterium]